ncbi:hypothetical protein Prudu_017088 [Prunus dulcis]|uniref:Uncharacterized protein n=1 Tax=Prunus dulcis TaxID=3755 RepID=A0A4Y1RN47_PRUDU|nr:hypothetical protein Prudu_017088 [Prunus dulcis]
MGQALQTSTKIVFTYYNRSCELSSCYRITAIFNQKWHGSSDCRSLLYACFGCKDVFDSMNRVFAASQLQLFHC